MERGNYDEDYMGMLQVDNFYPSDTQGNYIYPGVDEDCFLGSRITISLPFRYSYEYIDIRERSRTSVTYSIIFFTRAPRVSECLC